MSNTNTTIILITAWLWDNAPRLHTTRLDIIANTHPSDLELTLLNIYAGYFDHTGWVQFDQSAQLVAIGRFSPRVRHGFLRIHLTPNPNPRPPFSLRPIPPINELHHHILVRARYNGWKPLADPPSRENPPHRSADWVSQLPPPPVLSDAEYAARRFDITWEWFGWLRAQGRSDVLYEAWFSYRPDWEAAHPRRAGVNPFSQRHPAPPPPPRQPTPPPPPPPPPAPPVQSETQRLVQLHRERRWHAILGVEVGATRADVTRAYRRLALVHHPDKCPVGDKEGAEARFRAVRAAYDALMR